MFGEEVCVPDLSTVKLSRVPLRHSALVPSLVAHAVPLPPAPAAVDFFSKVRAWPEFRNDHLGDCTCAAVGHAIQQWSTYAGTPIVASNTEIEDFYKAVSGYDGTPETDRGAAQLDVLLYWLSHGALGQTLDAFTTLQLGNRHEMSTAVHWFGNAIVGLSLPKSADNQPVWTVPPRGPVGSGARGSLGGHVVAIVGYDPDGMTIVTWGRTMRMTWEFWEAYCVEAYALLSPLWIRPSGVDIAALQADMARLKAIAPPARVIKPA